MIEGRVIEVHKPEGLPLPVGTRLTIMIERPGLVGLWTLSDTKPFRWAWTASAAARWLAEAIGAGKHLYAEVSAPSASGRPQAVIWDEGD